ncbi:MAG: tetraacyldisaccharide 4'-kinase, partial [Flammeovirgaceae bacterium]|nr:tetraacyldisaccharide 4'-kinase [Flammeovirgaceae bacterium]
YGRKTKGFRIASNADDAASLGDEPFQFYKKFGDLVRVAVGEERALAIPQIMAEHEDTEVILLDDGYQHRAVRPSFSILLTDFNRLFFDDHLLPVGILRETKSGARRAQVVVVTKCPPHVEEEQMMGIEDEVRRFVQAPVFFSTIHYGEEIRLFGQDKAMNRDVVLFTGIANPKPLAEYLKGNYNIVDQLNFGDHHSYDEGDLIKIRSVAESAGKPITLMTTEKDAARLSKDMLKVFTGFTIFYLPIEIQFLKNGEDFDNMIMHAVNR